MTDTIIAEIRKTRDELARQFNFDLHQMCVELRREQEQSGAPVVSFSANATVRNTVQQIGEADRNIAAGSPTQIKS